MTEHSKSWRDGIKVHPAADLFPLMTPDELKVLGEDIKKNGLRAPIAVWRVSKSAPWFLVDGRNRLDAAELVDLPVQIVRGRNFNVKIADKTSANILGPRVDPYAYVLSANIHRRHLTIDQKRDLVAEVLKVQPEKSNRTIAKQTKVDHKTVGAARKRLEAGGEIPHHDVHEDARGTKQPAHRPAANKHRDIEDDIVETKAIAATTKDAEVSELAPEQTEIDECLARDRSPAVQLILEAIEKLDDQQRNELEEAMEQRSFWDWRSRRESRTPAELASS